MCELIASIPLALLMLLACHEAGRLIIAAIRADDFFEDRFDNALLRFGTGFITIGFVLAVFGLLYILFVPVLWILFIALLASAVIWGRKSLSETASAFAKEWTESRRIPLNAILTAIIFIALAMDFILTCVPTTAWDTLTYHYPLPAIWLRAHGFVPRTDICYSELPCGSEMLFLWAFGLGGLKPDNMGIGHLAANHLTWAAGFFAVMSIISVSRKLGVYASTGALSENFRNSLTLGLIAAVAFLSLPIVYVEEMEGGYIENFLVFFSLLLILALLHFGKTKDVKTFAVAGILAGGLLASKHTSLFIDAIVLVILIVWIFKSGNRKLFFGLIPAIIITIAIAAPWYIKSMLHTGDPMWPFITRIIGDKDSVPDIMYWSNPNVHRTPWGFINYIPRLTWDVSLTQFDFRLLTWYFLPLLPFVIFWSLRKGIGRTIGFITWILILLIYLLAPGEPRYMLAAWGLYAGLGAWGLLTVIDLSGKPAKFYRIILPLLLVIPIAFSLVGRTREVNNRVPTILGFATVDQYMEKSLDIWPLIKYINEETDPSEGVVLVEPRNFYFQREFIIWYPFSTPQTSGWDVKGSSPLLTDWQDLGMEHLVLTFGPNYRAIALAKLDLQPNMYNGFFDGMPEWITEMASYSERYIFLMLHSRVHWASYGEYVSMGGRLWDYDVASMVGIALNNGYGSLEFVSERSGRIYRLDQGENEVE